MPAIEKFVMTDYVKTSHLLQDSDDESALIEELGKIGFSFKDGLDSQVFFDANVFADYMIHAVTAVRDGADSIYLYHWKKHLYVEVREEMLKILCADVMNQICDLWTISRGAIGLEAFRNKIRITLKSFSSKFWLNLRNGLFNLKTMKLESHTPKRPLATQLPITYDPDASCPRFIQFMDEITNKDQELIDVLQEVIGYCLCQSVKAEKAFLFYGNGKNGKSVLAKVMEQLAGKDNVSHVMLSNLSGDFGLAPLVNKTLNIAAETESKGYLKTDLFKAIVSGDTVSVNEKYKPVTTQVLYCKLVFLCNSLPRVDDDSYGFIRKIMLIPFNVEISDEMQDVDLYEKLVKELPGIFNWAIKGLSRLRKNKYQFSPSQAVDGCMRQYKEEINSTAVFWNDIYKVDPKGRLVRSEIYKDYCKWAEDNGMDAVSLNRFWKQMDKNTKGSEWSIELNEVKVHGKRYIKGYSRISAGNRKQKD